MPAKPKKAAAPQPVKASTADKATEAVKMHRSGLAEGKSGKVYKFSAGETIQVEKGDLDHMGDRYCEKK